MGELLADTLFLCIDGGGTKTRATIVKLVTFQNDSIQTRQLVPEIVARGTSSSSNFTAIGLEPALRAISESVRSALEVINIDWLPHNVHTNGQCRRGSGVFNQVWAGLSGVDNEFDVLLMHHELMTLFGFQLDQSHLLQVTNDCGLLACHIQKHVTSNNSQSNDPSSVKSCEGGIVLIAGTGSIAMAFKPTQVTSSTEQIVHVKSIGRLGGYGYLIGDEGSAFSIGKQTLNTILSAYDRNEISDCPNNSDEESKLVSSVLDHFGVRRVSQLLQAVYALDGIKDEDARKIRIAKLCLKTMEAAYVNPQVSLREARSSASLMALQILERAASQLSRSVEMLCSTHHLNPDTTVLVLSGGVWGFQAFREQVLQIMNDTWKGKFGWVETVTDPDGLAAMQMAHSAINKL